MPRTTRTFVALPIPPELATRLARLRDAVASGFPGARWVGTGQYHVTLAFLGDVPDPELAQVCQAVAVGVEAAATGRFELALRGLGVFPDPDRPRTVWAGLDGPGVAPLQTVQRAIVAALDRVGYPPEDRRFSPHVTLGRTRPQRGRPTPGPGDIGGLLARFGDWSAGPFPVAEIVTYSSTPGPEGPVYGPMARARLKRGKPGPLP